MCQCNNGINIQLTFTIIQLAQKHICSWKITGALSIFHFKFDNDIPLI